jgi:hypothetical protein
MDGWNIQRIRSLRANERTNERMNEWMYLPFRTQKKYALCFTSCGGYESPNLQFS